MRVIERTELTRYCPRELAALYVLVQDEILRVRFGSQEWWNGIQTLDNIRREQAKRCIAPLPPLRL